MSASLVGSEMCIRDRRGGIGPPDRVDGSLPLLDDDPAVHLHGGVVILDPVSYTHLTLPTICSV
eukprot:10160976-Alexandrium_andersonii.AAC.1